MPSAFIARLRRHADILAMARLYIDISRLLSRIPVDFGGGCSVSKAFVLAELIRRYNLRTTLDIGVYRGRSLFPQALAHRRFTGGTVYGVDPWSNVEAREHDDHEFREAIDEFLGTTDFPAIYEQVAIMLRELRLGKYVTLVRKTSEDAISYFTSNNVYFDLVHIDGNHDTAKVMRDLELYQPRLKKEGFLVLDDASWRSVRPAYHQLKRSMTLVFKHKNRKNDYALFWNTAATGGPILKPLLQK